MNRTMTSIVAMGLGAVAYHMVKDRDMMSNRNMKKLRKRITKMMP